MTRGTRLKFEEEKQSWKNLICPTGISLWRKIVDKFMTILILIAVVFAVVPLLLILGDVASGEHPLSALVFLLIYQLDPISRRRNSQ